MGFRQAKGGGAEFAEGEAAGAIKQHVAERIADPAAHRAEPGVGELPRREGIVSAGRLDIAFDTEHPRTLLPVVTSLNAACEAQRLGRIVVDRTPSIAEVAAEIGTGPAIGV